MVGAVCHGSMQIGMSRNTDDILKIETKIGKKMPAKTNDKKIIPDNAYVLLRIRCLCMVKYT
jgi:hypothetical protein